jgi:hypothetical protein
MIYLATCSDHCTGVHEDHLLLDALESLGQTAAIRPWDAGDWRLTSGDLCVIRSTWNYIDKRNEFAVFRNRLSLGADWAFGRLGPHRGAP